MLKITAKVVKFIQPLKKSAVAHVFAFKKNGVMDLIGGGGSISQVCCAAHTTVVALLHTDDRQLDPNSTLFC